MAKGIKLPESMHCHVFRGTHTTNLCQNGVAIELILAMLEHVRIDSTKSYYAKLSVERLREAMESSLTPALEEILL